MVTLDNSTLTYNPEFYLFKHFSHFIEPGARLLKTQGPWTGNSLVFRNPNGEIIVVVSNPLEMDRELTLADEDQSYVVPISAQSFTTIQVDKTKTR